MKKDKFQAIDRASEEYTWSSIYNIDEDNYQKCLEWSRSYYRNIGPEHYSSLINCVRHALDNGNHSAFAHFFLQKKYDQNSVFCRRLKTLIEQQGKKIEAINTEKYPEKKKTSIYSDKEFVKHATIIKTEYWRSFDLKRYPLTDIKREFIYSKSGKGKWFNEECIPHRDAIVQIGIILSLTCGETNSLLLAAGKPALYVLDAVDVCSLFTLEKNKDNFSKDPKDKLIETKNEIDRVLIEYKKQGVPFTESKTGFQIASNMPFINTIETDIAELRALLEIKDNKKADFSLSNTTFLTKYYQNEINRLMDDKDPASYIESGNLGVTQDNDKKKPNIVFLHKYYGHLKKTRDFLLDTTNYEKNTSKNISDWDLSVEGHKTIKNNLQSQKADESEKGSSSTLNVSQEDIDAAISLVEKIFRITDTDSFPLAPRGKLSLIRQLVEGRNVALNPKKSTNKTQEDHEKQKYQMDMSSHITLIRFLVATCHEDQIDYYMNLSGMWHKNWYAEYSRAYANSAASDPLQKEDCLGRADFLVLYALLYRDALINKWQELSELKDAEKERVREKFPMIKLLLTVSRDIVLAFMKLDKAVGTHYGDYDNAEYQVVIKDYEKSLIHMIDNELVFPVTWYFSQELLTYRTERKYDRGTERKQHLQLNRGETDDLRNTPCWKRIIPFTN